LLCAEIDRGNYQVNRLFANAGKLPITGLLLACSVLAGAWGSPAQALAPEEESARQAGLEISGPGEAVVEIGALTIDGVLSIMFILS
jgi:hypothetical protein